MFQISCTIIEVFLKQLSAAVFGKQLSNLHVSCLLYSTSLEGKT